MPAWTGTQNTCMSRIRYNGKASDNKESHYLPVLLGTAERLTVRQKRLASRYRIRVVEREFQVEHR